jgi:AcrR family transcriptional regulator
VSAAKVDRRIRRTRELLHRALLSLIKEQGYDRITVQDIIDRADIGRSTFYAHYRDKDDLLLAGFEDIRSALAAEPQPAVEAKGATGELLQPLRIVFRHVEGHRHVWQPLTRKGGADMMTRIMRDTRAPPGQVPWAEAGSAAAGGRCAIRRQRLHRAAHLVAQ